jgi:hypothetical protein
MLKIVQSIYDMTGEMVKLPPDEDTAEKRVNKIFALMDLNKDHQRAFLLFVSPSFELTMLTFLSTRSHLRRVQGRLEEGPDHRSSSLALRRPRLNLPLFATSSAFNTPYIAHRRLLLSILFPFPSLPTPFSSARRRRNRFPLPFLDFPLLSST